jgi:acetyl esterase/lipase
MHFGPDPTVELKLSWRACSTARHHRPNELLVADIALVGTAGSTTFDLGRRKQAPSPSPATSTPTVAPKSRFGAVGVRSSRLGPLDDVLVITFRQDGHLSLRALSGLSGNAPHRRSQMRVFCFLSCLAFVSFIGEVASAACASGWTARTISGYTPSPLATCFKSGISYGPTTAHVLDVYMPDAAPPAGGFPVIVYVHGGGFVGVTSSSTPLGLGRAFVAATDNNIDGPVEDWAAILRQVTRGFAVVSIDYRNAGTGVRYTEQRQDVQQAIRWVRWKADTAAATYPFNPNQIASWGHSAGATLVTLAAGVRAELSNETWDFGSGFSQLANYSDTTDLVIGYAGAYDFNQTMDREPSFNFFFDGLADAVSHFLGCDHWNGSNLSPLQPCKTSPAGNSGPWADAPYPDPGPDSTSAVFQASPVRHLNGPPTLLVEAVNEPLIPPIVNAQKENPQPQARVFSFVKILANQPSDFLMLSDGLHGGPGTDQFWNQGSGTNRTGNNLTIRNFVDFYLAVYVLSPSP